MTFKKIIKILLALSPLQIRIKKNTLKGLIAVTYF